MFEYINIAHSYGQKMALSDMTLKLSPGVFGVLGANGAGKSTLLKIMSLELKPSFGEVLFDGKELTSSKNIRQARRSIGYLPQKFGYQKSFTVLEMLLYVGWLRSLPPKCLVENAREVLDKVDLISKIDVKMGSLSGGMVQRVGLACALIHKPSLVILDEPTVGLDPQQRLKFRKMIRVLEDVSIVLSTHLVEDIRATSNELIVLQNGELRFRGSPETLAQAGATLDISLGDTDIERGYVSVLRNASDQE